MSKIAIVAALEREVAPLVRNWKLQLLHLGGYSGPRYRLYENGESALICSGIGPEAARRVATTVIQELRAQRVVSVGFAGALDPGLKVGDVLEPSIVINGKDGSRTDIGSGKAILVSAVAVAGQDQKRKLREAYAADIVDMEAAGVAQSAQAAGIEFSALKAISDVADFAMPPMEEFVGEDGRFDTSRFVLHVAVRPRLWAATMALGRNSRIASEALCDELPNYLERIATTQNV